MSQNIHLIHISNRTKDHPSYCALCTRVLCLRLPEALFAAFRDSSSRRRKWRRVVALLIFFSASPTHAQLFLWRSRGSKVCALRTRLANFWRSLVGRRHRLRLPYRNFLSTMPRWVRYWFVKIIYYININSFWLDSFIRNKIYHCFIIHKFLHWNISLIIVGLLIFFSTYKFSYFRLIWRYIRVPILLFFPTKLQYN